MNKQSLFPEQVFDVPAVSVRFSLLGTFRLQCGDKTLSDDHFHLRKARDLLKLLALAPNHRLHREEVLDLLWSEQPPQQAAHNLSQTLYTLRPNLIALDPCIRLAFDEECLSLLPAEGISIDVEEFEKAARTALSRSGKINNQTLTLCQEAIRLYTGDLLPDDGPSDLFYQCREQLRQLFVDLLLFFAHANLELNSFTPAIQALQQVINIDPAHEEAHFQLMRAYALNDQRQAALRQYELLTDALRSELGVAPSTESTQLCDQIQKGESIVAHHRMARKIGKCPYRGLFAFQEVDAPFYFGRSSFVDALEEAIKAQKLVVAIVGSSGSGKSSALYAGLFPRLRKQGGYQFVYFRPGYQPFYALADALIPILQPGLKITSYLAETMNLADRLVKGEASLQKIFKQYSEKASNPQQLLLVIDQFEELYTLCPDVDQQKAFVDELLACVDNETASVVILIALRADFMGQALAHRPFADTLQEASLLMGPMTRDELRLAIEKPAELQGAAFEPGLVERILDDVGEKPGNLPLLEFTLTQLWECQTDGWLTHSDYEAMAGVEGALASYADQVYAGLEENDRERARQALVQLVQPGEGTEDTRRIATREELGDESWQVIQHLADQRLVVTGRDVQERETAEVVHEALIRKWEKFQAWMESDRAFRAWQEQLRTHVRGWQESGQDEGALLHGVPLGVAQTWLKERVEQISPSEKEYIDASLSLQERLQNEYHRRRQRTVLALIGGLVIALVLAFVAFQQRQAAKVQAGVLLASQAESELENGKSDLAILLALAALQEYPYTAQAEHALGQAVTYNRSLNIYEGHSSAVTGADWSSDGKQVATISADNSVHIWDASTGELIRQINLPKGITGNIYDWGLTVKWTPDNRYLLTISGDRFLTGSQDYDLFIWDVKTGEQITAVEVQNTIPPSAGEMGTTGQHFMTGAGAKFASDGRVATLGGDNTAMVWGPMLAEQLIMLRGHTEAINAIDWSPDFTRLATASEDATVRIWNAENGQELMQLVGHSGGVNQVDWTPEKNLLATAGDDGNLILWDGASGEKKKVIQITTPAANMTISDRIVWSITWSPDGSSIATGTGDGYIRLWDVDSGGMILEMKGHDQFITYLDWSPNNDRLISTSIDGKIRIWNVTRDNMLFSLPYGFVYADWSPDGNHFAVGTGTNPIGEQPDVVLTEKGMVTVWDFKTVKPIFETFADKDEYWGWTWLNYSPDGEYLLSRTMLQWPDITDANKFYIFDSQTGEIIKKLETNKETLLLMGGWSPDSQMVAAGDYEGTIYFWDVNSGKISRTMNCLSWGHIVQWSPDGSKIAMLCLDFENSVNTIQMIDAKTYEIIFRLERDYILDQLQWFRWSPDSTRIAVSGGSDETGQITNPVYVFDANSGEELLNINRHTSAVSGVGWSPDGKRIVSGSTDDTTRIWDAETGAELLTLSTPNDWWSIPDWSPDGQYLFISIQNLINPGKSGVFRVWQSTEELIDYAKECCVFRELTDAERTQFGLD